eukprot:15360382-Ditylum_brightwellii.AAC.1
MSHQEVQDSHDDYKPYPPKKFKERIYQEVRRGKYTYYLNKKRNKKILVLLFILYATLICVPWAIFIPSSHP